MDISIKHFGTSPGKPAKFIQLTVENSNSKVTEDITNLKGEVSTNLIAQLELIVEELKEQNSLINDLKKSY